MLGSHHKNNEAATKHGKAAECKVESDSGEYYAVDRDDDSEHVKGTLHKAASSVLMKILYAARMARPDLLRPTTRRASYVTKWSPYRGTQLHRLVCYIWITLDCMQEGHTAQSDVNSLQVVAYADAYFAGCLDTPRSATDGHLCLEGKRSLFPIHYVKTTGFTCLFYPQSR